MNDRNRLRMLIGIIIALVVLNAGLLTWMWVGPRHQRDGHADGRLYLSRTLGFSDDQRLKYRAMRQRHFQTIRPLLDSMKQERRQFFRLVSDSTQTPAQLTQQAQQLAGKSARLDVLTLRHFRQVSTLCTPEQRQKLQQLLAERPGYGSYSGSGWSGKHGSDSSRRDRSEK